MNETINFTPAPSWGKKRQNHSYRSRGRKIQLPDHMKNIPPPRTSNPYARKGN